MFLPPLSSLYNIVPIFHFFLDEEDDSSSGEDEEELKPTSDKVEKGAKETEAGAEISALVNYVQPVHFTTFESAESNAIILQLVLFSFLFNLFIYYLLNIFFLLMKDFFFCFSQILIFFSHLTFTHSFTSIQIF